MTMPEKEPAISNGAALASFLAAGIGTFALGAIVILNGIGLAAPALYEPAGGVSGRTTLAAVVWLVAWVVLHMRWRDRTMRPGGVYALTLIFIALGVLFTFPPVWEVFS